MSEEARNCPECGRPVAMKAKAACAYCGARLPWADAAGEGALREGQDDIQAGGPLAGQAQEEDARRVTYPVACGACGERLPETKPETCPRCHTPVRDPFTGTLVSEPARGGRTERRRLVALVLATLVLCIILLTMSYFLRQMTRGPRYPRGTGRPPAPAAP